MTVDKPCIVYYCADETHRQVIISLCRKCALPLVMLDEETIRTPLGLLCSARDWNRPFLFVPQQPSGRMEEDRLVFSGLNDRTLDRVLSELKKQRCYIANKAVLTPANAMWNALMLQEHLFGERPDAFVKP